MLETLFIRGWGRYIDVPKFFEMVEGDLVGLVTFAAPRNLESRNNRSEDDEADEGGDHEACLKVSWARGYKLLVNDDQQ